VSQKIEVQWIIFCGLYQCFSSSYTALTRLFTPVKTSFSCPRCFVLTTSTSVLTSFFDVQIICIWSRWCHCLTIISCFIKIQIVLTFLLPAYPGCRAKESVKRGLSVCTAACCVPSSRTVLMIVRSYSPSVVLKVICNGFSQNWWKVVSSCLLQYQPVCVINFDKLRSKMLKSRSLVVSLV